MLQEGSRAHWAGDGGFLDAGTGREPVAAAALFAEGGSAGGWCGPARAMCIGRAAQTMRVVAEFRMVNHPPDPNGPKPLNLPFWGRLQRVSCPIVGRHDAG